mgnify:FL=1
MRLASVRAVSMEWKMITDKQTYNKSIAHKVISSKERSADLASKDFTSLRADIKGASPSSNFWDLEKKKEQFLTIDRF